MLVASAADVRAQPKRLLTPFDYGSWRTIEGTTISRDGSWLVYSLVSQDGDGELVARNVAIGKEYRQRRGRAPVITADARFVIFSVAPLKADLDRGKKDPSRTPEVPQPGLGILNLSTGAVVTVSGVRSFAVADESGRFVAYLRESSSTEKRTDRSGGLDPRHGQVRTDQRRTDLVVRELATGIQATIDEVIDYTWNQSGSSLAYTVSSITPSRDGVFARRSSDGVVRTLLGGPGQYKDLVFDRHGAHLAFLSDRQGNNPPRSAYRLYMWMESAAAALDLTSAINFPDDRIVSKYGWTTTGTRCA